MPKCSHPIWALGILILFGLQELCMCLIATGKQSKIRFRKQPTNITHLVSDSRYDREPKYCFVNENLVSLALMVLLLPESRLAFIYFEKKKHYCWSIKYSNSTNIPRIPGAIYG